MAARTAASSFLTPLQNDATRAVGSALHPQGHGGNGLSADHLTEVRDDLAGGHQLRQADLDGRDENGLRL